jgi:glycosyltransferase 2 family protein
MSARSDILRYFKPRRIIIPLILGLGVSAYFLFWGKDGMSSLNDITWRKGAYIWLVAAIGLMVIRDLGYILRLRILSERQLTWRQCFQIIMLWEFASAVSPGAIGGTAAAVVIMAQEKMKTGLTTAIVLVTSFLDELYYMVMTPIAFWAVMNTSLFPSFHDVGFDNVINTDNLRTVFWSGYIFLLVWTLFLAFALFIKPEICRGLIMSIVKLPFLKRFSRRANRFSDDLLVASKEFRAKPKKFWLKSMGATFVTWTARFLVINCLIMLLNSVEASEHWVIFGKQLVMWILMMIALTPGASGVAEFIFPAFMGVYLPTKKVSNQLSILWRIVTYYPYILIGIMVLPLWLKRVGLEERFRRLRLRKQ